MEYRTDKECRYYGSDLNKFIDEETDHLKTCINLDCLLYKRTKKRRREIESKHWKEKLTDTQRELLNERKEEILLLEKYNYPIKIDLFVISVDFDRSGLKGPIKIEDWISGITKIILCDPQQFKDWLDFKLEFKDIIEDQNEIEWGLKNA